MTKISLPANTPESELEKLRKDHYLYQCLSEAEGGWEWKAFPKNTPGIIEEPKTNAMNNTTEDVTMTAIFVAIILAILALIDLFVIPYKGSITIATNKFHAATNVIAIFGIGLFYYSHISDIENWGFVKKIVGALAIFSPIIIAMCYLVG